MRNKVLHFLRKADGFISGEEISRQLKISRAGIWKYIQELRKSGYEIAAVPHSGYRLLTPPDKLTAAEIQNGLRTRLVGRQIEHHESIKSTMDAAFQLAMDGASDGTVVCAESQTKGKGRLGRGWISPKGKGIYMSVILRPAISPADVAQITLLSAVAVCEAVTRNCGVPARIKWPNDILISGKKAAGILTELSAEADRVRFVVVGIGVNVNTPLSVLPATATSLKDAAGKKISRIILAQEILNSLEFWYMSLQGQGFAPAIKRWKELTSTLGQHVRVEGPNGYVEGTAEELDPYGGLIIRSATGETVKKMSGDVIEIGPGDREDRR